MGKTSVPRAIAIAAVFLLFVTIAIGLVDLLLGGGPLARFIAFLFVVGAFFNIWTPVNSSKGAPDPR